MLSATAQDMLAVDWSGQIYELDPHTGLSHPVAPGFAGMNALCVDHGGRIWSIGSVHPVPARALLHIDAGSLAVTPMFVLTPHNDVRALAAGPGNTLYAITRTTATSNGINRLLEIDTVSGSVTLIGNTGTASLQAMAMHNAQLYAWDLTHGLGTIDPSTGVWTDVDPLVGGNDIQWLGVRGDGLLVGGGNGLHVVDPATGTLTMIAPSIPYFRGADTAAFATRYGAGCDGGNGPVVLSATGTLRPGSLVTTHSVGHATPPLFTAGVLLFGTSKTTFVGVALPLLLDPAFGTVRCHLFAAPDGQVLSFVLPTVPPVLRFSLQIPPGVPPATLHLQHVAFDPVPGDISTSNGLTIRIR